MSYASYHLLVFLKPIDDTIVIIYVLYNTRRKAFSEFVNTLLEVKPV